jgi:hypothetical protein
MLPIQSLEQGFIAIAFQIRFIICHYEVQAGEITVEYMSAFDPC